MTTTSSSTSTTLIISARAESTIEPVPEGLHGAVCIALYDVGTLYSEKFDTAQRKLIVTWELPGLPPLEIEREGQKQKLPRFLSRRFTMSLNEKANLRQMVETWRGRKFSETELAGFDVAKLCGQCCQLQIMHEVGKEGRIFANVANVLPPPRGTAIRAITPTTVFSVANLTKPELPIGLPDWVSKLVMESREWERLTTQASNKAPAGPNKVMEDALATEAPSDDVPF